MWANVLLLLRVSQSLGPMLRMILAMIGDLGNFLVFLFYIILIFVAVGVCIFVELAEYNSFKTATLTLFDATLGNYDYTIFKGGYLYSQAFGYTYLTIFLILGNILMLNFLIAILSNTYAVLEPQSQGLYLDALISVRHDKMYDPHYSGLICAPFPLNSLSTPFIPLYFFVKSKAYNDVVLVLEFFIIAILLVVA